jgi:hypothetical protein
VRLAAKLRLGEAVAERPRGILYRVWTRGDGVNEEATFFSLARDALSLFVILLGSGASGVAAAGALVRDRTQSGLILAIGLIVGVAFFGWVFSQVLIYFPGLNPGFYAAFATVYGVAGLAAGLFFARGVIGETFRTIGKRWSDRLGLSIISLVFWVPVVLLLGALAIINLAVPLYGNDSLEYAQAARKVFEMRDLGAYPFMDRNVTGGLITPWTHPPGYLGLLALGDFVQGSANEARVIKLVAAAFVGLQVILVVAIAGRGRVLAGALAGLLLLIAPLYYAQAAESSIDAYRIATFSAAIASFWLMAKSPSLGASILAGVVAGLAAYSHSIGMLTLGFAIPLFVLIARGAPARSALAVLIAVAVSLVFVVPHVMKNLSVFGSVLQDNVEVWTYPELQIDERLAVERGISTFTDALMNGVLRAFTQTEFFGFQLLLLLAGLVAAAWGRLTPSSIRRYATSPDLRSRPLSVSLIVLAGFLLFLILTWMAGSELAIKNARYMLTVQPFIAIALAIVLVGRLDRDRSAVQ